MGAPVSTMTGTNLITISLRLIGAQASGESLDSAIGADALVVLNQLADDWSMDGLLPFTTARQTFALAASTQTRTLGSGGNFNVTRPTRIVRAGIIDTSSSDNPEYPIDYYTDPAKWAAIPIKSTTSTLPREVWDDCGFPLRTLSFYPISTGTPSVALYTPTALTQWAALATDVTFPPGYLKAFRYNLAMELAAEFGLPIPPQVAVTAAEMKGNIRRLNTPLVEMRCDPAIVGRGYFNIKTGEY